MDVERGSASTQKHLEVIRLDISELTTPLPEQVKARWGPYKQRQLPHSDVTLDQIQAKLAAADEKRKVRRLRFESNELDLHSTCRASRCLIYSLVPQLTVSNATSALLQETLRWVMTRAQSHSIPSGTSDGGEQRGKRLQVHFTPRLSCLEQCRCERPYCDKRQSLKGLAFCRPSLLQQKPRGRHAWQTDQQQLRVQHLRASCSAEQSCECGCSAKQAAESCKGCGELSLTGRQHASWQRVSSRLASQVCLQSSYPKLTQLCRLLSLMPQLTPLPVLHLHPPPRGVSPPVQQLRGLESTPM